MCTKLCVAAIFFPPVVMVTVSIVSQVGTQSTRNPAYHWFLFELGQAFECAVGKKNAPEMCVCVCECATNEPDSVCVCVAVVQ